LILTLQDPVQTSDFQSCEITHFSCLKPWFVEICYSSNKLKIEHCFLSINVAWPDLSVTEV
jgi:hypothetical protein